MADLTHVIAIHNKYHGNERMIRMGLFSRPSIGDRMDRAEERRFRMRQSEAELRIEQANARMHDREAKKAKHEAKMKEKYKGK